MKGDKKSGGNFEGRISLSDTIRHLRSELTSARDEGAPEALKFEVADVELELQVGVTDEGEAGGGIKFWILNIDGKGKTAVQAVQKIKLKLTPLGPDGNRPLLMGDRRSIE